MASVVWSSRNTWMVATGLQASALLMACSRMLSEPAPQVETAALHDVAALHDAADDTVIATLHTKDSELKITSSGGRVRYSLIGAEGTRKSLTLDELQSYDRNLYEFVKNVTAQRGPRSLDARVAPGFEPSPRSEPALGSERVEADRHRSTPPER
jgi:hypothetical protein